MLPLIVSRVGVSFALSGVLFVFTGIGVKTAGNRVQGPTRPTWNLLGNLIIYTGCTQSLIGLTTVTVDAICSFI